VNARRAIVLAATLGAFGLLSAPASAKLVGGTVERRPAADPAAEVARLGKSPTTVWLAWTVPARGDNSICGFGDFGRGSRGWGMTLDDDESSWGTRDGAPPIALATVEIYAAVRDGEVRRLRFASEGCPVQAGQQRVVWLDGVRPAASVDFIARLASRSDAAKGDRRGKDLDDLALAGLSFHADPAAPLALVHLAREGESEELRSQALFWLAQSGEPRAARWIREAIARDPAGQVREQGVFALSQLEDSTPLLLALLRESADRDVKRQAIFWLGQSDDPRATAEIERLLTR
jgi:hypothetical protein